MKWTIAVLSTAQRKVELTRITAILRHQIGDRKDIQLLIADGVGGVGEKRQWCIDHARGEYVNFVDDDDIISHVYVDSIHPLLDGVDYVGFRMQHYRDGHKSKPTFHSLAYEEWSEDEQGFYRDISHLNPMKTTIARQATFSGDYAEDHDWAEQLRGIPKTQNYIYAPMYFYFDCIKYSLAR